ncbi:MAG TPA: alginate export family protein, partial [Burkholderiaceae bacterium]|nr:alginate export family protein [Burkholderiaceae bacterium]
MRAALAAAAVAVAALTAQAPPQYRQLRYEEDWRYLRDPARAADGLDAIKYMPLDDAGASWLSLGGEVRERYEYFHNSQWGGGPQDQNGYLLQRYMLHGDL